MADLFKTVVESTDLPEDLIKTELLGLLSGAKINPEALTMEQLHSVLTDYLQDVLVEVKKQLGSIDSNS